MLRLLSVIVLGAMLFSFAVFGSPPSEKGSVHATATATTVSADAAVMPESVQIAGAPIPLLSLTISNIEPLPEVVPVPYTSPTIGRVYQPPIKA